jgi:uncharacterized protein (DUF885 family)
MKLLIEVFMKFSVFKDKLFDFLSSDPNFCAMNGLEKLLGDLPDPGKNKRITNQGKLLMLTNTLRDIKKSELDFDDQIDYELIKILLEQDRLSYELDLDSVPHDMRMPKAADMISDPLFMFYINDFRNPKLRLVNIISRLEKVPDFLISYKRNINTPVERWVNIELEKVAGLPDFFNSILNWAKEVEFKRIEILEKSIKNAVIAIDSYKDFLVNVNKSQNIFIGNEQMKLVLNSKGIEQTPEELHTIAKDFSTKNKKDVEELRVKLCLKYDLDPSTTSEGLQKILNEKYKVVRDTEDFSYLLNRYELERENILKFIKDKDLFPIMEKQDMKIMQTPEFMKPTIPAGAMMPPLSMREGTRNSLVYLTLSEELLDEHTELSIPGMMIHEGIPGHHLQLAWASMNKSFIRKFIDSADLYEGWTTMLEDYMLDVGYVTDLEDEVRFSGKRDIARIGARVAIDLYFMSGDKKFLEIGYDCDFSHDDPFVNAAALLKAQTGFVDGRVQAELNWYSQERGYPLSYLTGNHLVWKLRREFNELYSDGHTQLEVDREFHKRFLEAGNMPVSILRSIILKEFKSRA